MDVKSDIKQWLTEHLQVPIQEAGNKDIYYALLLYVKNKIKGRTALHSQKKVYYISSEFLIGKLLGNNLINLSLYDDVSDVLASHGKELSEIEEVEPEPSLGNGGLGRLAACFLDSMTTLGLPGTGISLNYHYGLFKQKFSNNLQNEEPNPWIEDTSWLNKCDISYKVDFDKFSLNSVVYEIDITGYHTQHINKLCLFDIGSLDASIVHDGIIFDKTAINKNLTLFLYPDDSDEAGHLLRIAQQYFMVSNAASLIFAEMEANNYSFNDLHKHVVIQINDTHPTLVIPELICRLIEKSIVIEDAAEIVAKTVAYTNHTILAEALEKWPLKYLEKVVPALVDIIKYLDLAVKRKYPASDLAIIDTNNFVHMARLDIHYSFSVNGVAALHTDILKHSELAAFHKIYPTKFNNKTNGITFRRWLMHCNAELTSYLSNLIGPKFKQDALALKTLNTYSDDVLVLNILQEIKQIKKQQFIDYAKANYNIKLSANSIFDVQIKRIHEYKRQQMNALYIIHKYLEIKSGIYPKRPISFIFGGKAAPAYKIAKHIIHLLLCLQQLINNDDKVSRYIKILFVENYNVGVAEKLIPAADISEQISLASKEASGTGNMKFMLNGALTIGTMDGANVEIAELVGLDNIYIFGKDSKTVMELYQTCGYKPLDYYNNSNVIKQAVDFIKSPQLLALGQEEKLTELFNELINKDWFMSLIDLVDYIRAKDQAFADYENKTDWARKCLINIAHAGYFSSDRTIAEYNKEIWKLK
ncbi:MAG: maltose phosphorylase [Burkholderiales bacterium]|jgi:starch phosphorylase|nr:maltose phosphorylase [Burkholderiales bacterium]